VFDGHPDAAALETTSGGSLSDAKKPFLRASTGEPMANGGKKIFKEYERRQYYYL
jgi:hypothetical protein